jgi:hypothetical protein
MKPLSQQLADDKAKKEAKQDERETKRTGLQRIEDLEKWAAQVDGAIQQLFGQAQMVSIVRANLNSVFEQLGAVTEIMGTETIRNKIKERQIRQNEAQQKAQKEALDNALVEGKVKEVDAVTVTSIVVGHEIETVTAKGEDGSETKTERPTEMGGYVQLRMDQINPKFHEQLVGKGKGHAFATTDAVKFVIDAVYEDVPPPVEEEADEASPATPAPTAEAAAQA